MSSLMLGLALGGCAAGGASSIRAAERQATLERWRRCVERQGDVATFADMYARLEQGCEGHRRDVLRVFPPNMEPRLRRLMDERRNAVLSTRLRESEATRDASDEVLRVIDALSAD